MEFQYKILFLSITQHHTDSERMMSALRWHQICLMRSQKTLLQVENWVIRAKTWDSSVPKMFSNFQAHSLGWNDISWEKEFWILVLFLWKSWKWLGNSTLDRWISKENHYNVLASQTQEEISAHSKNKLHFVWFFSVPGKVTFLILVSAIVV